MTTLQGMVEFATQDNTDIERIDEDLDLEEQQQQTTFDISEIGQAIKVASEGALTGKTVSTYRRYSSSIPLSSFNAFTFHNLLI